MRLAERPSKSASFHVTEGRWYDVTPSEGGVLHGFWLRCTTAVFVYLTHSAVVSQFENATMRPKGRMLARTRATPPKTGGSCDPASGTELHTAITAPWGRSRPHLSLREGSETAPKSGAESTETDL